MDRLNDPEQLLRCRATFDASPTAAFAFFRGARACTGATTVLVALR